MEYKLDEKTINEVLKYLAKRPYVEVHELIPALQSAEEITTGEPTKSKKEIEVEDERNEDSTR